VGALILSFSLSACGEGTQEPPRYHVLTVEGTPYERGYQHGKALAGEIRYFYTKFLSAGILPWFNRERSTIAEVLEEYNKPKYDNDQFAYRALLDSGNNLLKYTPKHFIDELQGMADGSGVEFDRIVILNTFLDTLFGMRSLIMMIRNMEEPRLASITFEQEQGGEWVEVGRVSTTPSPFASITEIPVDARFRLRLFDAHGVDRDFVRIQHNDIVYLAGESRAIEISEVDPDHKNLDILFTPPEDMATASVQSLQIQAGDQDYTDWPPPLHASVMRDERTVFTTEGYAEANGIPPNALHEIPNVGAVDERLQPTSLSFALRGTATTHGQVLAAHHFTGLDNDTAHKCGVVTIHKPSDGKPFVTVGMAGVIWGSSGMSSDGLSYMYNLSDTLDNPVSNEFLEHFLEASLISSGTPIGFLMRDMMQYTDNAQDAREYLRDKEMTFGWNILLADAQGNLAAVELEADILDNPDGGYFTYSPPDHPDYPDDGNLDASEQERADWASERQDDLRMAMHFQVNEDDILLTIWDLTQLIPELPTLPIPLPIVPPQRFWTTYYYRSIRTFYRLGEEIDAAYGTLDLEGVKRIIRIPDLNDMRNSMNSAIYAPDELKMWYALGEVPATSAPFRELDFGAMIGK